MLMDLVCSDKYTGFQYTDTLLRFSTEIPERN